jgi:hypothetical protein
MSPRYNIDNRPAIIIVAGVLIVLAIAMCWAAAQ